MSRAELYSPKEAAAALGISYSRMRVLIAEGRVKVVKVGGINVIYPSDLEEFRRQPRHIGRPRKTIRSMKAAKA